MGRYSTGAITTGQALRIELSYLLKNKLVEKNHFVRSSLSWTNGSNIGFESKYFHDEAFIRLFYKNTNNVTNEVTNHDYKVYLTTIQSNLGKGDILYFICPVAGNNCRILYNCYGSTIWKSRDAYQNRIYYEDQLMSKKYRPLKYIFIDKKLEELYNKKTKSHYRGKPTKIINRIDKLLNKSNENLKDLLYYERMLLQ